MKCPKCGEKMIDWGVTGDTAIHWFNCDKCKEVYDFDYRKSEFSDIPVYREQPKDKERADKVISISEGISDRPV
jgi:DNA-directed RNA polymerase subunit M/transcription elongation factor TFIIS